MNIPYEIGQNIWQVRIYDYRGEKRIDFCTYEISSITIKRNLETKLRLTSCDNGKGWVHEIPETYVNREEPVYNNNKMKYFTNKIEASEYCNELQQLIHKEEVNIYENS